MFIRRLQQNSRFNPLNRQALAPIFYPVSQAYVRTTIPTDNMDNIPPEMMKHEQQVFRERVSQKQRDMMSAHRLAALRLQGDMINDENAWWNKLVTMTEEELKLMPMGFIKKYGSYISNMARYDKEFHLDENKQGRGYFEQVKSLKRLLTDEQKKSMIAEFKRALEPDVVTMKDLVRREGDYMRR